MDNIKMPNIDDLFGNSENDTQEIEINLIDEFKSHPYKVKDDGDMITLIESINEIGITTPILVRESTKGRYEVISGHRRIHASKILGLNSIPAIIKKLTDDEAIVAMVDSNLQRTKLLPSEKAWAYRLKREATSRQGRRTDLEETTSGHSDPKLEISRRTENRYIRLSYCIPELIGLADEGNIGILQWEQFSRLSEEEQKAIYKDLIREEENPAPKPQKMTIDESILTLIPTKVEKKDRRDYIRRAVKHYVESYK